METQGNDPDRSFFTLSIVAPRMRFNWGGGMGT